MLEFINHEEVANLTAIEAHRMYDFNPYSTTKVEKCILIKFSWALKIDGKLINNAQSTLFILSNELNPSSENFLEKAYIQLSDTKYAFLPANSKIVVTNNKHYFHLIQLAAKFSNEINLSNSIEKISEWEQILVSRNMEIIIEDKFEKDGYIQLTDATGNSLHDFLIQSNFVYSVENENGENWNNYKRADLDFEINYNAKNAAYATIDIKKVAEGLHPFDYYYSK